MIHRTLQTHHGVMTTDLNAAAVRARASCSSGVLVLHRPVGLLCVLDSVWILSGGLQAVPPTALIGP